MLKYANLAAFGLLLAALWSVHVSAQRDLTMVPGTAGSDIVRAVISKIDVSMIFTSDNRLLRRIAFAQTRDGTSNDTYSRPDFHGGIWGLNEAQFNQTRSSGSGLDDFYSDIAAIFGIDWLADVEWEDLRKPFFSGLAARLFLATIPESIPLSSQFLEQASYYVRNYDPSATVSEFINDVSDSVFSESEECDVYSDVMFLLDSSGSIGDSNYIEVRDYVRRFSDALDIGPRENQVGVIVFSNEPEVVFDLNSHQNKSSLLNAIEEIPYLDQRTNTGDALRLMINHSFTFEAGARLDDGSIFRLAVVMTDGRSNEGEPVETAAAAVHGFEPPILVYVVAVGSNVEQEELEKIATAPEFIDHLDSFNPDLLTAVQLDRLYQICFTTTLPAEVGNPVSGVLDEGQQVRYQFPIPQEGITVRLCVRNGRVAFFASTSIPNPSQVAYDFTMECLSCEGCELFVSPDDIVVIGEETVARRRRRQAAENETLSMDAIDYTNFTLYVTVEGVNGENSFELGSDVGDTTESDDSDSNVGVIVGVSVAIVTLVAVVVSVTVTLALVVAYRKKKTVVV